MIRIGFVINTELGLWPGGVRYFTNLLRAIDQLTDRVITPVLLTARPSETASVGEGVKCVEVISSPWLGERGIGWWIRRGYRGVRKYDGFLERLLIKNGIDVLSHSGYIGRDSRIPTVGWIPDLQHQFLREFFSPEEITVRDKIFQRVCDWCKTVVVSSESAKTNLTSFYPQVGRKCEVLRFVASLNNRGDGCHENCKEQPYLYLPNQFWIHKNHRIVIEAVRVLKKQCRMVRVVATGAVQDYRQPGYFKSIQEYVQYCDVNDLFVLRGNVPREEVEQLMFGAKAVINPSLFEGWSTTVEEARSMGKRLILSDIPVHREQCPPGSVFFDPNSVDELAEKMWKMWLKDDATEDDLMRQEARLTFPARQRTFARSYEEIVKRTVSSG